MLYLAYVLFAGYVITRFGRVITASRALPVWLVLLALGIILVVPDLLLPVASMFGVQVVSNLVFATMILFLLFESLTLAAEQTKSHRQLRRLVARLAQREFAAEAARREASTPAPSAGRALVVVPAYNEAESIAQVVTELGAVRVASGDAFDVVVVDDGSGDDTAQAARAVAGEGVYVLSHTVNCGVGGVLLTGFLIAREGGYDYAVQCDGDGQHPVQSIPELLRIAAASNSDLLIGSRFCEPAQTDASTTALRRFGGRMISLVLATFGRRAKVTDPTSGFRVHSRRAFAMLARDMPDEYPEPESVALCAIHGLKVEEAPVRMHARQGGESSISGWKSAVFMIKVLTSLLSFRVRHALGRAS